MITTIWAFILVLSGLILVHELGHFLVARGFGVRVLKFSIGFGPRIFGIIKNGTDYCISLFPLGGFVKMLGEQPDEEVSPKDLPGSFSHRPVWQRALIVAAGPLSNFLFAWVVFFFILVLYGNPVLLPVIGEVTPDSPAMAAGLKPGDKILMINDIPIDTWEEVSEKIKSMGERPLKLVVERGGQQFSITVTPKINTVKNVFGEEVKVPLIGVTAAGNLRVENVNPIKGTLLAFERTWDLIALTVKGFLKIFERTVPLSSLGGPILIAQMAGQQAELGLLNLFYFMALLSINLGFLNLLPIPVLDGGHLFFYLIEAVIGRPLTMRQMEFAQRIGFFILGTLMFIVFYNDILRLLGLAPNPLKP
ncbi:Membrane-associated zinc metalloprotease [Dissulfuribacter thermophilus]|uniref:Zinc metalloprotease n=1 Tax=Dissulfuribacter thermophilus TaxID=1156395 RepID=A0A1B9F7X2_9BACT|nr:RIP metalloprotease RseP [Dissulfuribacter thermophilus]OCC16039.1 Membrane-associated zinc metalloprotease [Dissulfuribacter thermophilus]